MADGADPPALVRLDFDGPHPSPRETARRLLAGAALAGDVPDSYGEGGAVAACEAALAAALGQERAILLPTGTLANLLALDRLCGRHARRVAVQVDSHLANDTGDGAAALAGLTLVPLAEAGAGFRADALGEAIARARTGRVAQGIGAAVVETPVRRRRNARFPEDELAASLAVARAAGVPVHLDGARLPIAAAARGVSMAEFAAPFAGVYLSLWKMLGVPFGAALAGPAGLIEGMVHDRRRWGGGLAQFWPVAALTLDALPGLEARWRGALARLDEVRRLLGGHGALHLAEVPDGTNIAWLEAPGCEPARLAAAARERGLILPPPESGRFAIRANETWLALPAAELVGRLAEAANAARA